MSKAQRIVPPATRHRRRQDHTDRTGAQLPTDRAADVRLPEIPLLAYVAQFGARHSGPLDRLRVVFGAA
jgi:hypothetical protein